MPLKLLAKLEELASKIDFKKATEEAPHVRQRCDACWSNYLRLVDGMRKTAPAVEQLKGMSKGLEGAVEIVGQFKVLIKTEYQEEKITKEEAAARIDLINKAQTAVQEGAKVQREEFVKSAGKIEGIYSAAVMALDQIKNYLATLRNQYEFIEKNPTLFDHEAKPPPPTKVEEAALLLEAEKDKADQAKAEAQLSRAADKVKARAQGGNGQIDLQKAPAEYEEGKQSRPELKKKAAQPKKQAQIEQSQQPTPKKKVTARGIVKTVRGPASLIDKAKVKRGGKKTGAGATRKPASKPN